MAEKNWKVGKVEIVWRRGSKLLKRLVIALIVLSTAALGTLWWVHADLLRQAEKMQQESAVIQNENQTLEQKIKDLGSVQSIQEIAKEELGMVPADTVLINPRVQK